MKWNQFEQLFIGHHGLTMLGSIVLYIVLPVVLLSKDHYVNPEKEIIKEAARQLYLWAERKIKEVESDAV